MNVLVRVLLQMLMDPMGGIVMTNDGNAILREVFVSMCIRIVPMASECSIRFMCLLSLFFDAPVHRSRSSTRQPNPLSRSVGHRMRKWGMGPRQSLYWVRECTECVYIPQVYLRTSECWSSV